VWGAGSGAGGDNLWSTGANWTSDTVPATTDTVTFSNVAVANCTVDNVGTFTGQITVASTYSGVITQNVAITGASAFSIAGGTWTQAAAFTRSSMTVSGGTWTGASQAMSLTGLALSGGSLTMTSGTCTITTGTFTQTNTPTFNANGGTIHFAGGSSRTLTAPNCTLNLVTYSITSNTLTVALGTTCPLGDSLSNTGGLTVNGAATWTNSFTTTLNFIVAATGTLTVSGTPALVVGAGLTFSSGATITSGIAATFNGTTSTVITAPDYGPSFSVVTISKGSTAVSIAAGTTIPLGNNPTTVATLTITGGVSATGSWTHTGTINMGVAGSIVGTVSVTPSGTFTGTAGQTCTGTTVIYSIAGAGARTFAGGGGTMVGFTRIGAGAGTTTITGTNTFTGAITDNQGSIAHSLVFPNVTTTVGDFIVAGSSGKLVTLQRTGAAGTFTLTKTGGGQVDNCDYLSISNSTVDASPLWYAGSHSTDGGGNTNWIFGDAVTGTLASTLSGATLAAEGYELFEGEFASTLAGATLDAEGEEIFEGELDAVLAGCTLEALGTVTVASGSDDWLIRARRRGRR
jgi:fibronectin-binding autotransporter adhesin